MPFRHVEPAAIDASTLRSNFPLLSDSPHMSCAYARLARSVVGVVEMRCRVVALAHRPDLLIRFSRLQSR